MKKLTLGSLFDGSGGFPLGAFLSGIEALWASEVEPFPIRVTTKRLPTLKHYGDINTINGADVPPVDIITGGFCCQDLSVAGKRAGLHGERSGLFFQITRIIREMLDATNNKYPKFAVLENVPGMYSSNGGLDFQEVLNEIIRIKDESLSAPLPEKGKWSTSGEIVGDGFSIGWRTLDAQFWGVAQRRRRCYIVVDFTGERAGEILFDETRLRGNPPQSEGSREGAAADAEGCIGTAGIAVLNDQGGKNMDVSDNITGTLRAAEHGHQPLVFEPGAASRFGGHCWQDEPTGALRADMGDNQLAVAIENHPTDSRVKLNASGTIQTLTSRMGTGGGNVPMVMNGSIPQTLKIRSGCEGGGRGALIQENKSATLSCNNDQTVFVPTAYGICSDASNAIRSGNPNSGIYEADTSRTLDGNGGNPSCNQGGMAVVALQGSMIGRDDKNGPQGSGVGDDVCFTLNTTDKHAVAYTMTTGGYPEIHEEQSATLMARDYKDPQIVNPAKYTVRRLTPQECALLQGFSSDWCANLETSEPSDDEIAWWSEVFETHRKIMGTSGKPKSRNQIIKWLQNPHSDAAE